ncbi:MAG: hypothetical protein N2738_06105 [Thermodesulfovibrionales bacterium]|nr:hypothetical protein [Thermodesulfovibrionales bacterium]
MKLTVSIAQIEIISGKPRENISHAEDFISEASKRGSQLICLPEMWTTGFDWDYLLKNDKEHLFFAQEVCNIARKYKIWIYSSMPFFDKQGALVNAGLLINPEGFIFTQYNKTHLFSLMNEEKYFNRGEGITLVDTGFAMIGLSICYDLRFLELFRSYALKGAELILLTAAFPYPRLEHWKVLIKARAIENQLFFIAVNRVGKEIYTDGKELYFFGNSSIIDPWGKTVVEASEDKEELLTAELDLDFIKEVRQTINVFKDRRADLYEL